ncbi:hypothetical protein G4B88_022015 [Cannabis sativa]|uniref:Reverse transcriptase zinc-binding domain-containing protein n=1 Tax=Cannabis sativa TaxID=3483 RepID=A0A7J6G019_CANSA|nr:hypothetical protein G4B88_022015 [Cannabis sativa]
MKKEIYVYSKRERNNQVTNPQHMQNTNLMDSSPQNQYDLENHSYSIETYLRFVMQEDGRFSVKAAYHSISKGRQGGVDRLFKTLWKSSLSERVKLFLWKVERDILPCGQRLHCLFENSSFCVLCDGDVDSLEHLFFHCHVAHFCWFRSSWGIRSDLLHFGSPRDIVEWIFFPPFADCVDSNQFSLFAAYLCFYLWKIRNLCYHEVNSCDLRNRDDPPPLVQCDSLSSVDLGLGNRVNIFVDATVRDNVAFYAVLVLDYSGKVLEAFAGKENVVSSLDDEARAILNAISRCLSCGWSGAMIFFQIVKWRWMRFWLGRSLLGGFILVNNGAAHKLAARAASQSFCGFFDQSDVLAVRDFEFITECILKRFDFLMHDWERS